MHYPPFADFDVSFDLHCLQGREKKKEVKCIPTSQLKYKGNVQSDLRCTVVQLADGPPGPEQHCLRAGLGQHCVAGPAALLSAGPLLTLYHLHYGLY